MQRKATLTITVAMNSNASVAYKLTTLMHCTQQKNKDLIQYTRILTSIVAMDSNIDGANLLI